MLIYYYKCYYDKELLFWTMPDSKTRMADNSNFVLRWEIYDAAATFASGTAESEVFNEGGFKWKIGVQPNPYYPNGADITLSCDHPRGGKWRCKSGVEVVEPWFEGDAFKAFNDEERVFNFKHVLRFNDLLRPNAHFNINGKVTVEFRVNIISSECSAKFSSPNEMSNVTLVIEETKVKVSKDMLAIHSPVFSSMFFGDFAEKGKEEVELKDVVYEEFIDVLNLLFFETTKISDHTVQHILKLADKFQMESLLKMSKEHLMNSSRLNAAKKLLLADLYRLTALRDHCLQSFTSLNEAAQKLMTSPEYGNFSGKMKIAICDRIAELSASVN